VTLVYPLGYVPCAVFRYHSARFGGERQKRKSNIFFNSTLVSIHTTKNEISGFYSADQDLPPLRGQAEELKGC